MFEDSKLHSSKSSKTILPSVQGSELTNYEPLAFDDTLERETILHTIMNSQPKNPKNSYFTPQEHDENFDNFNGEEYDPYEPEPHAVTYGMEPNKAIILQLYEDWIIRFDIVKHLYYDYPLNGILGAIKPSYSQVNENGNSSEI